MPTNESLIPPEQLTIENLAEIFSEAGFPNKVQPGTNRMVFDITPATVASVPSIVTMVRTESHKLLGPMLQASASACVKPADSYVDDGRWELLNWMNQWEWSLQCFLCGSVSETHGSCGDDDSPDVIHLRSQLLIGAGVARSQLIHFVKSFFLLVVQNLMVMAMGDDLQGPLALGTESGPEVILPREASQGAQHSCPASSLNFGSVGADTTNNTPNAAPTAAKTKTIL